MNKKTNNPEPVLTYEQIDKIAESYIRSCGDHWCYEDAIPELCVEDFARDIERAALEAYVQKRIRAQLNHYGYGIVDKDGKPYIDHDGYAVTEICENYARSICDCLNASHEILGVDGDGEIKHVGFEPPAPYRVVRLEWVNGESDIIDELKKQIVCLRARLEGYEDLSEMDEQEAAYKASLARLEQSDEEEQSG